MALTLTDPFLLLDDLASNNQGNTPRPSRTLDLFYKGMRALGSGDAASAEKSLVEAIECAKQALKDKTGKLELEYYAIVRMGLGFLYIQKLDTANAEKQYTASLKTWVKLHNGLTLGMVRLMRDVTTVFIQNKKWPDALNTLKGIASQLHKHKKKKSIEMAEALCRMGMVMAEIGEAKEEEVRIHFVKAAECVSKTKSKSVKPEMTARALAFVYGEHVKWVEGLKAAGKGEAGKLDAELVEMKAKLRAYEVPSGAAAGGKVEAGAVAEAPASST